MDKRGIHDGLGQERKSLLPPGKKALKWGKIKTTDSSVIHKVMWPHGIVYTATGKPAEHNGISMQLFVSSYLAIITAAKPFISPLMFQHTRDLMSVVELHICPGAGQNLPCCMALAVRTG